MIVEAGFERLRVEFEDGVATVWMDNPPVNAVDQLMYGELHQLFSTVLDVLEDVRVVILAGTGRHFCGGNDLREFQTLTPANARERMFHVREAFWAIYSCEVPVIAAVHGSALGTGLAIAASCDFIVAADDAQLGLPELTVGVMGGAKHLSRLLPQPLVRYLFYTAQPMAATEFARLGGVIRTTPREELLGTAQAMGHALAAHGQLGLRYAKRSLNEIEFRDLRTGYEFEQGLTVELSGHPESAATLDAFITRRLPNFK